MSEHINPWSYRFQIGEPVVVREAVCDASGKTVLFAGSERFIVELAPENRYFVRASVLSHEGVSLAGPHALVEVAESLLTEPRKRAADALEVGQVVHGVIERVFSNTSRNPMGLGLQLKGRSELFIVEQGQTVPDLFEMHLSQPGDKVRFEISNLDSTHPYAVSFHNFRFGG